MPKPHAIKTRTLAVPPAGQQRPRNRWTMWAQTLRERHGRIAVRHRALAFILTRSQAVSLSQIERWHHTSVQLLPKIRLAIGPFFFNYLYRRSNSLFAAAVSKSFARLTQRFNSASPDAKPHKSHQPLSWSEAYHSHGSQKLPWREPYRPHSRHAPSLREQNVPTTANRYLLVKAGEAGPQNSFSQSAFMRVFARLDQISSSSVAKNFETRRVQSSLQLVNRVINERRRREDFRRNLVSREHREYVRAITNVSTAEAVKLESTRALPAVPTSSAQTSGAWSLDIDRLTDQVVRSIDSRIVAHRERIGRVF